MPVKRINKDLYYLKSGGVRADIVITPTLDANNPATLERHGWGNQDWVPVSTNDNVINEMLTLVWNSPTKPRLLDQAKEFILGAGFKLFREEISEEGKEVFKRVQNPKLRSWFRAKRIQGKFLEPAALSLAFMEQAYVLWVENEDGSISLETIQPNKVRIVRPAEGEPISHVIVSPYFGTVDSQKMDRAIEVPVFDWENPLKNAVSVMILKKAQIGSDFYNSGLWWGTKVWTEIDNLVPEYHQSGLKNGYNFKLLIEIDESYFIMEGESLLDEVTVKEVEKRKDAFCAQMDDYLAGVKNTDKALVIIGKLADDMGKDKRLIRVTTIDNKMTDDAYMNLTKMSGMKQAQGHGILPSLAGIAEGDKLGGSGSELEHSVMFQVRYMTPSYRRLLKETLDFALEAMGFDLAEGEFMPTDIEMTTLAQNPTGQQPVLGH